MHVQWRRAGGSGPCPSELGAENVWGEERLHGKGFVLSNLCSVRKRSKLKAGHPFRLSQVKLPNFTSILLNTSPLSSCTSCYKVPARFGWTVEAMFPGILAMCVWKDGILSPLCHSGKEAKWHRTLPTQQRLPKSEFIQQNVGPMDQKHLLSPFPNLHFDYSIWKHGPLSQEVVFAKPIEGSWFDLQHQKPNQTKLK